MSREKLSQKEIDFEIQNFSKFFQKIILQLAQALAVNM